MRSWGSLVLVGLLGGFLEEEEIPEQELLQLITEVLEIREIMPQDIRLGEFLFKLDLIALDEVPDPELLPYLPDFLVGSDDRESFSCILREEHLEIQEVLQREIILDLEIEGGSRGGIFRNLPDDLIERIGIVHFDLYVSFHLYSYLYITYLRILTKGSFFIAINSLQTFASERAPRKRFAFVVLKSSSKREFSSISSCAPTLCASRCFLIISVIVLLMQAQLRNTFFA